MNEAKTKKTMATAPIFLVLMRANLLFALSVSLSLHLRLACARALV